MGQEQLSSYYDDVFATSGEYAKDPDASRYANLWRSVAARVAPDDHVIELGCGPGHLASILGCRSYLGIDFSPVAVMQAKERIDAAVQHHAALGPPHPRFDVQQGTLPGAIPVDCRFTVAIACEFLEHVTDDIECLQRVRAPHVLATVPSFDDPAHVRHFPSVQSVIDRYTALFDRLGVVQIGPHYLLEGWR